MAGGSLVKPVAVQITRIMCSDAVANTLAVVVYLFCQTTPSIKWRIQELPVDILKQTIAAAKRSGSLILELGETTDLENDAQFTVFLRYRATKDYVEQFVLPSTCQKYHWKVEFIGANIRQLQGN